MNQELRLVLFVTSSREQRGRIIRRACVSQIVVCRTVRFQIFGHGVEHLWNISNLSLVVIKQWYEHNCGASIHVYTHMCVNTLGSSPGISEDNENAVYE